MKNLDPRVVECLWHLFYPWDMFINHKNSRDIWFAWTKFSL